MRCNTVRNVRSPHPPASSRAHPVQTSRRQFLRAAGVSLALPCLDAFVARGAAVAGPPRRMICICAPLGFYPGKFFPQETGKNYKPPSYLEVLSEYRDDFTVISGLAGI